MTDNEDTINRKVLYRPKPPRRPLNCDVRPREYLTPGEVERLANAAQQHSRYGDRDAFAIRFCARHGFRATELCTARWDQIDFELCEMHVRRLKKGTPSVHPLNKVDTQGLHKLYPKTGNGVYIFVSERRTRMTPQGFGRMLAKIGYLAGFTFRVHPHMLRHACGYNWANQGKTTRAIQKWMGHRNIGMTTIYTELAADHFKDW
jgi:integrase